MAAGNRSWTLARSAWSLLTLGALLGATVVACGDDDTESASTGAETAAPAATSSGTDELAPSTVSVSTETVDATTSVDDTVAPTSVSRETTATDTADGALEPQPLAQPATLRLGLAGKVDAYAPVWLAQEFGEFTAENLTVEISIAPLNDLIVLLQQGQLDVAAQGYSAGALNLINASEDLRFVWPNSVQGSGTGQGFWMRQDALGDDGTFSPDDVKGITIGATTGNSSASNAWFWKEIADLGGGVTPSDVTYITLANADAANALVNGAVPLAFVATPFDALVAESNCCVFLDGSVPTSPTSGLMFGPTMYDDANRDAGLAFIRTLGRVVREHLQGDYKANPEIVAALATQIELPAEQVASIPSSIWDPDLVLEPEAITVIQDYFAQVGLLDYTTPLAVDRVFDTTWVETVTAQG